MHGIIKLPDAMLYDKHLYLKLMGQSFQDVPEFSIMRLTFHKKVSL